MTEIEKLEAVEAALDRLCSLWEITCERLDTDYLNDFNRDIVGLMNIIEDHKGETLTIAEDL